MSLSIAVFVPEGVVIGCDQLSEVFNSDDGFSQDDQTRVFAYKDQFLINVIGKGYSKGLPYAYYVERAIFILKDKEFGCTKEFVDSFCEIISKLVTKEDQLSFYISGIDQSEKNFFEQKVYLVDNKRVSLINRGRDNDSVYNYHAIGNSVWIDKLLLPSIAHINEDEEIQLDEARIDFSKYSIQNAKDFVKSMLELSYQMDLISQIRPRIGNSFSIGILKPNSKIQIL